MREVLFVIWFGIALAALFAFANINWRTPIEYFINTAKLSFYILLFFGFVSLPYLIYSYI